MAIDRGCGVVGCGADAVETYQAFDRLLAEHMFAIELCHLGVFSIGLHLGIASADTFLAGVLGDTELIERVIRLYAK